MNTEEANNLFGNVEFGDMDLGTIPRHIDEADEVETLKATAETEETTKATDEKKSEKEEFIERYVSTDELGTESEETEESDDTIETETEEEDESTSSKEAPSDNTKVASSPYSSFAKSLSEDGVIPEIDDELWAEIVEEQGGEAEALIALNRATIDSAINNYKKDLDEDLVDIIEAREKGVNLDNYKKLKLEQFAIENISDEDLVEDVSLQKKLVSKDLKAKGYSDEEIVEELELYEHSDKLEAKAKRAKNSELARVKQTQEEEKKAVDAARANQERQYKDYINKITLQINDTEELIPGMKLNKTSRTKLLESMTKPVAQDEHGNPISSVMQKRAEDPVKFEMLLHYFNQIGMFDQKFDKLTKTTKTSAINNLKKQLEGQDDGVLTGKARTTKTSKKDDKHLSAGFASAFGL